MNNNKILNQKNIGTVIIFVSVFFLLSLAGSIFQTPEYSTNAKALIVFQQNDIDPYTATKTTEYITSVLGEVIYSNNFIDNVIRNNTSLKKEFDSNLKKRKKQWHRAVETRVDTNRGIIEFDVYHPDKTVSNQLSQAIISTIVNQHQLYHGLGKKISIKIIDQPTTSDNWAKPNILLNSILGLIAGLLVGITIIIIYPQQTIIESSYLQIRRFFFKDETMKFHRELEQMEETNKINLSSHPEFYQDPQEPESDREFYNQ